MKQSDKEKYEKEIQGLEKRIRKLEEEKKKVKGEGGEMSGETNAGEILKSVGRMFGLEGLIKSAEKLPEFQERLTKVDEELKRKLGVTSLKTTKERTAYKEREFKTEPSEIRRSDVRKERAAPREREVDIFDEAKYVLIIIEIPGADEKSIKVNLKKDKLTIFVDKAGKEYHKEIILPCVPEGEITKSFKNGILEIKIKKAKKS